jgi:hypothetical protein
MKKAVASIGREIVQQTKRHCTGSLPASLTMMGVSDATSEWSSVHGHEQVKPFEEIPGHRSFPIIGTTWAMFPGVGTQIDIN